MDSAEQPEENTCKTVTSIVHDFDKMSEKKTQKRENTLISYAMKAVAREQEHCIMISKLKRELAKAQGLINLLEMEIDVKEKILKEKEQEIKKLKEEMEVWKNVTIVNNNTRRASLVEAAEPKTPLRRRSIFNEIVISTQSNIVASPNTAKDHVDDIDVVSSSKVDLTDSKTSTPKAKVTKRRSIKRNSKETHVTSFLYNLRSRTKSKTNEKI